MSGTFREEDMEDLYICAECGRVKKEMDVDVVCTGVQGEDQIICDKCLKSENSVPEIKKEWWAERLVEELIEDMDGEYAPEYRNADICDNPAVRKIALELMCAIIAAGYKAAWLDKVCEKVIKTADYTNGCRCMFLQDQADLCSVCKEAAKRAELVLNEKEGVELLKKVAPQFIIYTATECGKCIAQKKKWDVEGVSYEERDVSRIKSQQDEYDRKAHVESAMQNEMLPVIIKREDIK